MNYVEALDRFIPEGNPTMFLAGGITGCPDWQDAVRRSMDLMQTPVTLLNPRRKDFPMDDPNASESQIRWEFDMLLAADLLFFWFCEETVQPIVLYELGRWAHTAKPMALGVHPRYVRRQDVEIQVGLLRPDLEIANTLPELIINAHWMVRNT